MADQRTIFILDKVDKYKNLIFPIENPFKKFKQSNKYLKGYQVAKSIMIGTIFFSTLIRLTKTKAALEKLVEILLILVAITILQIMKPMLV
jgi:hypothetical protein